jgi:hypothetical protein
MGKTMEQILRMNIQVGDLIKVEANGKDKSENYTGELDTYVGYNVGFRMKFPGSGINLLITPSKSQAYKLSKDMMQYSSVGVESINPTDIKEITVLEKD